MLREGSIVDASIISAPSSTKNSKGERDPEMHQTRKGNQWYFGMKMHTGVDDGFGMIHSLEVTAANEHDLNASGALLHGDETRVFGDSGYRGIHKRAEHRHRDVDWFIARRPGVTRQLPEGSDHARRRRSRPVSGRRSSIRFAPSSVSSVTPRFATAAWRRTPTGSTCWRRSATCLLVNAIFPRRGSVSGCRRNGGNRTKDEQKDQGFIAESGPFPKRNQELAFKPGYSEVP